MAKQATESDKREAQTPTPPPAETAAAGQAETASAAPKAEKPAPKVKATPATTARMVEAKLLTRHCRGGVCKEKGETMPMTQGEYARLKQHGRVE